MTDLFQSFAAPPRPAPKLEPKPAAAPMDSPSPSGAVTTVTEVPLELVEYVKESGVELATAESLQTSFSAYFCRAKAIIAEAKTIVVTDESQVDLMSAARAQRLQLKAVRVEVEHTRKKLKEDGIRRGKAIEGLANVLKYLISPVEEHLQAQEEFAQRAADARKAALQEERLANLRPYGLDGTHMHLAEMSAEQWAALLDNAKIAHEARQAAAQRAADEARQAAEKAEAERIAREKAAAAERERMQAENERLRREAAEREAEAKAERERIAQERATELAQAQAEREEAVNKARAEREKLEAEAKVEREARAKLEAETLALREAEEKRQRTAEEAREKAARAPDRDKLLLFAASVRTTAVPTMQTDAGREVARDIAAKVEGFAKWIEKQVEGFTQ